MNKWARIERMNRAKKALEIAKSMKSRNNVKGALLAMKLYHLITNDLK